MQIYETQANLEEIHVKKKNPCTANTTQQNRKTLQVAEMKADMNVSDTKKGPHGTRSFCNRQLQGDCRRSSPYIPDAHVKTAAVTQLATEQETQQGVIVKVFDLLIDHYFTGLTVMGTYKSIYTPYITIFIS